MKPAARLFVNEHPRWAEHWDPRNERPLADLTVGSGRIFRWKCPNGPDHEWTTKLQSRRSCPFCGSRQSRLSVTNSLSRVRPDLAREIHPFADAQPPELRVGDRKAAVWKCPYGPDHVWRVEVRNRSSAKATGCPHCASRECSVTNSLARTRPDLAAQLDPVLNEGIDPRRLTGGAQAIGKLAWRCSNGPDHVWLVSANNRISNDTGCPFEPAGSRVSVTNSLRTLHPELAHELDGPANGSITAISVRAGSTERLKWRCSKGHSSSSTVVNRTTGRGCPVCHPGAHSIIEIRLAAELALFLDIELGDHQLDGFDVDMVDRGRRLVIEYDGAYHHQGREAKDVVKSQTLEAGGWRVIRVRVAPLAILSSNDLVVTKPGPDPKPVANKLLEHLARLGVVLPDVSHYLAGAKAQNSEIADAHLKHLRRESHYRFEEFFERLVEFKNVHHHLLVTSTFVMEDGYPLGEKVQDYRHRERNLADAARRRLDDLGFADNHWEAYFDLQLLALADYASSCEAGLGSQLPKMHSVGGRSYKLRQWVQNLRARYRANGVGPERRQVSADQARRLETITGWIWTAPPHRSAKK